MGFKMGMGAMAVVVVGATALGVAAVGNAQNGGGFLPYLDTERVANGASVYTYYCASCHGLDMSGEADWRSPNEDGLMPAPPHDETGHTWHHNDEQLFFNVKYGTERMVGGNYKSNMEGYEDSLSDDEIINVLAFIKSRWPAAIIKRHNQVNGG